MACPDCGAEDCRIRGTGPGITITKEGTEMESDTLVFFDKRGEPLEAGTAFDDVRVAYQLRGKDAEDAVKAFNEASNNERKTRADTEAKAIAAAKSGKR